MADGTAIRQTRTKKQVFDIANCGPRHRFVVRAPGYEPFIAHNCIQGLSRIVMSEAMIRIDSQLKEREAGMLALTVHDENVSVVLALLAEWCNDMMDIEMSKTPQWCDDRLVLATKGGIDDCYSK